MWSSGGHTFCMPHCAKMVGNTSGNSGWWELGVLSAQRVDISGWILLYVEGATVSPLCRNKQDKDLKKFKSNFKEATEGNA